MHAGPLRLASSNSGGIISKNDNIELLPQVVLQTLHENHDEKSGQQNNDND